MIDIKTILLSNMLVCAFFFIAFTIYTQRQKTYWGFGYWTISVLVTGLAFLSLILRGTISTGLSVMAVNGLFVLAGFLRLDAIRRFLVGKRLNRLFYTIPICVAVFGASFYFAGYRMEIRNFILSAVIFILLILISWHLFRYSRAENRLLYYSCGIFVATRGISFLIRAILLLPGIDQNVFDSLTWSKFHFEFGLISEIGLNVIFLMMVSKRAEEDLIKSKSKLNSTIIELKHAMSEVKKLQGILPICSHCKKIRDDRGAWQGIEKYVRERSEAQFSHGICPECAKKFYPDINIYDDESE